MKAVRPGRLATPTAPRCAATTADTIARMFLTRWSSSPSSSAALRSAALRSPMSRATSEAPTIRPSPSRTGEIVIDTSTGRPSLAVLALSKDPNPTVFQKTLGLNDFYFGSDDFEFPLGNIQMIGKSQAEMYRGEKPLQTKLAPTRTLEDMARHAIDFWLSTEDLPRPENRVTLNRKGEIQLSYKQTNHESAKRLYHELKKLLAHTGMHADHLIPRHA